MRKSILRCQNIYKAFSYPNLDFRRTAVCIS